MFNMNHVSSCDEAIYGGRSPRSPHHVHSSSHHTPTDHHHQNSHHHHQSHHHHHPSTHHSSHRSSSHHQPQRGRSPSSMGRSTPGSDTSHSDPSKSRMRWILSLGLLLPALAAIIGVVAWAVSAEVVMGTRRELARNSETFKTADSSFWLHQTRHKPATDELSENDRLSDNSRTSSSSNNNQVVSRTKSETTSNKETRRVPLSSSHRNETQTVNKLPASSSKNANIYFLSGIDSLTSKNQESEPSKKKSTGAQVAEVIDRMISQRKHSHGHSPHIVVVAPMSDTKSKTTTSTTTTTTSSTTMSPQQKSYSRDADTLLAAAQLLAAQHKIAQLNRMDSERVEYVDTASNQQGPSPVNNAYNSDQQQTFESANLLNHENQRQQSNYHNSPPQYSQALPPPPVPPPTQIQQPSQTHYQLQPPPQPQQQPQSPQQSNYVSSSRIGYDASMGHGQHIGQIPPGPPPPPPPAYGNQGGPRMMPMPPPPPPYPSASNGHTFMASPSYGVQNEFSGASFDGGSYAAESFPAPSYPGFKNNRAILNFHAGEVTGGEGGHGGAYGSAEESNPGKGITLHFGGGPVGGGGQIMTSPLGIFKTLLLPLLPKPRVNLNGKVVFGVVLEKGVGFGKQKQVHHYPGHYGRRRK